MSKSPILRATIVAALSTAMFCCSPLSGPLAAAEATAIVWHSDMKTAWQSSQQQGRPLLVFVTTDHCMYCTKMKRATYAHPAIAATINRSFVPLVVDGESSSPLLADLAVKGFPATFIISPDAVILDRMDGFVAPDKLLARLTAPGRSAATPPGGPNR